MVLGMMATASAANFYDFTDKDEIRQQRTPCPWSRKLGIIASLPVTPGATQNIDPLPSPA